MYCKCGYNNPVSTRFCKNCEVDLYPDMQAPDHIGMSEEMIYAGFLVRFFAVFLDALVLISGIILLLGLIAAVILLTGRDQLIHDDFYVPVFLWTILFLAVNYNVFMLSGIHSATLGKRWMNIKVLNTEGDRLTPARAFGRLIALLFSHLLLLTGFLIQPFTPRKRALHDLLAGTIVVRVDERKVVSIMASLIVIFFTLLLPVLAILFTAGLPILKQQILTVQLEQGIQTGKKATLAIAKFYRNNGRVPASADEVADITTSPHVSRLEINQENGELKLTFSETVRTVIRNKHLLFSPTLEANFNINWKCHSDDIEARILPASCR